MLLERLFPGRGWFSLGSDVRSFVSKFSRLSFLHTDYLLPAVAIFFAAAGLLAIFLYSLVSLLIGGELGASRIFVGIVLLTLLVAAIVFFVMLKIGIIKFNMEEDDGMLEEKF